MDIDISSENRKKVVAQLNNLLANEFILYIQTLNYHWNIKGPSFIYLHEFLEDQYKDLFEIIDDIAERITTLGFCAIGTLDEFNQHGTLPKYTEKNLTAYDMLAELIKSYDYIIKQIRQSIHVSEQVNDQGTNSFLTNLLEKQEKMVWMLRAHTEK